MKAQKVKHQANVAFLWAQPHSNAVIENVGKRLVLVGKGKKKLRVTNGNVKTVSLYLFQFNDTFE